MSSEFYGSLCWLVFSFGYILQYLGRQCLVELSVKYENILFQSF